MERQNSTFYVVEKRSEHLGESGKGWSLNSQGRKGVAHVCSKVNGPMRWLQTVQSG